MAKASDTLERQAASITQAANSLSTYLASQNTDDTLEKLQQSLSSSDVKRQSARIALVEACNELLETVIGPTEYLTLLIPTVSDEYRKASRTETTVVHSIAFSTCSHCSL